MSAIEVREQRGRVTLLRVDHAADPRRLGCDLRQWLQDSGADCGPIWKGAGILGQLESWLDGHRRRHAIPSMPPKAKRYIGMYWDQSCRIISWSDAARNKVRAFFRRDRAVKEER